MGQMEEDLDTIIGGIYIGFSGDPSSDGLAFGLPVNGSTQLDEETGYRARFEDV